MDNHFLPIECNDNDVISFQNGYHTYKIARFTNVIREEFGSLSYAIRDRLRNKNLLSIDNENYFVEGIDCEILRIADNQWKKGKVKIKVEVEFYIEDEQENNTLINEQENNPLINEQ